jgi:HD-GYP domain-containing protein (c-di-GMP phosphodiesterase class II)
MNTILTSELKPGISFSHPVYMDQKKSLLVGANVPLKTSDIERLKRWNIKEVYSEGEIQKGGPEQAESRSADRNVEKNLTDLYRNIVQNREKCKAAFHEMLEKTRLLLSKFKSLKEIDDQKILSIHSSILSELDFRKPLLMNLVIMRNSFDYIISHSLSVAVFSALIGRSLGFSAEKLLELSRSALLHNCGMLFLPGDLAVKKGKYTDKEMHQVKTHPLLGYKILNEDVKANLKIALAALEHHENYDGTGYPRGIRGKDISEYARIITIADVYTALAIEKEYRNKLNTYLALREIISQSNLKFDPDFVKAFVLAMSIYPIGTIVRLNNKCTGIVVEVNDQAKLKPFVKLLVNEFGDRLVDQNIIINLLDEKKLFISQVISEEELGFKLAE